MVNSGSVIPNTSFQTDDHLVGDETTSEPGSLEPQIGLTETHLSLDCVTAVDEWPLVLLDSLDKQGVSGISTNELLRIEDDAWASLIRQNTLYQPMPDHLPSWHNDLCLHCKSYLSAAISSH